LAYVQQRQICLCHARRAQRTATKHGVNRKRGKEKRMQNKRRKGGNDYRAINRGFVGERFVDGGGKSAKSHDQCDAMCVATGDVVVGFEGWYIYGLAVEGG